MIFWKGLILYRYWTKPFHKWPTLQGVIIDNACSNTLSGTTAIAHPTALLKSKNTNKLPVGGEQCFTVRSHKTAQCWKCNFYLCGVTCNVIATAGGVTNPRCVNSQKVVQVHQFIMSNPLVCTIDRCVIEIAGVTKRRVLPSIFSPAYMQYGKLGESLVSFLMWVTWGC